MNMTFTVEAYIAKPVARVFEAVADPEILSRYFTTGGAKGCIETGEIVYWSFHDFPGEFPVKIMEALPEQSIVFQWATSDEAGSPEEYVTTVTIIFKALADGRTHISITETGWRETDSGLTASYSNCSGWMQMLCSLKAYLEYGINLREGMFK